MPSASIPAAIAEIGATVASIGSSVGAAAGTVGATAAAAIPEVVAVTPEAAGLGAAASTAPAWLSTVETASLASSAVGGLTGAYGAYQSGQAQANAAKYNAAVESQNAAISTTNAQIAGQAGAAQAGIQGQKNKATLGAITANQGASGIDLNSGSDIAVRSSARELGELDALSIRSNAARQAYGYENQAVSQQAQSTLSDFEAKNDQQAGQLNAASTFLGSAGSAASNFARYQLNGGFTG